MAASDEWRWTDDQGVQRVVRTDELRSALASSVLAPSTLVWREGMAGWVPAFTVPELGAVDSPVSVADPPTDATTQTDVSPPPRIAGANGVKDGGYPAVQPPPLVVAGKLADAPAKVSLAGSVRDTGRPTPTELLNETGGGRAEAAANGSRGPRPAAGQDAAEAAAALKIGAAPKPLATSVPRVGLSKVESNTSSGKGSVTRGGAGAWRKPEGTKAKDSDDVTLVADAADPFKLRGHGEERSNGASSNAGASAGSPANAGSRAVTPSPGTATSAGLAGAAGTSADAGKEPSRVAMSLAARRPVTKTALLTPNEPARPLPAAGRPASTVPPAPAVRRLATGVPPPPVQVGARRSPSTAPAAGPARSPSAAPAAAPADAKGFRTTAFMGSGTGGSSRPAPGGLPSAINVPAPPRVPSVVRPNFSITENTSTDSTGVLPLGGSYSAEPTAQRAPAPSFVEGAPAFAERTPSFPDGPAPAALPEARPPMRSRPPPADAPSGPMPLAFGSLPGSYPPVPQPTAGGIPRADMISSPRIDMEIRSLAQGSYAPPRAPMRSDPPPAPGMQLLIEGAPYSAPPPPLALSEPSYGEIRTTGALPLVNPKRGQSVAMGPAPSPGAQGARQPSNPEAAAPTPSGHPPPILSEPPPDVTAPGDAMAQSPSKVGDPVIVPLSSLFGAGAMLIGMAVMAFFVGRCSVAPGPSASPARAVLAPLPRLARAALPTPPKPCWMAKQPVRWAPAVVQSVPVDVAPTPKGVIVAYARDAREPATVEVDFATGALDDKAADKREADLVRVFAPRDGAGVLATTKSDAGPLAPYVFAPAQSPFVIGVSGRGTPSPAVAFAEKPDAAPVTLWTLPPIDDDKGLEAARVIATGPSSHAVVFRRAGSILGGFLGDGRKAEGALGVIAGSGGSVGKPSLGTNKREVAVVFGDKSGADAPWEIRVGHAPLGTMPRDSIVVPLPSGGPGGDAFAPDVAGVADGRWVLVWTEGKSGAYAVRAQTFGADFKPLGDPIAISPPAGNFGQAVVGVAGDYVTTMFLSRASSGSYELWGAVLQCGS